MSRRAVPTQLKIIKSTDRPDRVRNDEPKPTSEGIAKPRGMSLPAQVLWPKFLEILLDCKIMTVADVPALRMLCESVAELEELRKMMRKTGIIVRGRNRYPVITPLFGAINQKTEQVRKMLGEFGLTPGSRTRVGTTGDDSGGEFDF